MEEEYLCVIKNDPANWIIDTLDKIKEWVLDSWDLEEPIKLIKVQGEFKETKIETKLSY